mgnify:CR=1 FL=1
MSIEENKYIEDICISSDFAELIKIRDFISDKANNFGFSDDQINKIVMAVDEACTNLIKHSNKFDKAKNICIQVETDNKLFIVNILDDGIPFNPINYPSPDINDYLQKPKSGGLGIFIIKRVMDNISYIPSNKKTPHNILRLTKYLD